MNTQSLSVVLGVGRWCVDGYDPLLITELHMYVKENWSILIKIPDLSLYPHISQNYWLCYVCMTYAEI